MTIRSTTKGISPENPTAPTPTIPLLPQSSSSPKPHELSSADTGGPNTELTAGIAAGTFLGLGIAGLIGFGAYKCIQNHRDKNAAPSDVEASSAQTDRVSCGGGSVYELDYAERKGPGLLSRVRSYFRRNKPNDAEQLDNLVRNSSSHSLGSDNTHNKSPNVDIEHNPVSNVRRSSDSNDSNQSDDRSIYEPHVSVVGSGPASSELPGSSRSPSPNRSPSLSSRS
ncbi:hypothetical protein [Wolbachia endosymbiont (group E) of Neria commutata]|uniref:hypothetical protein n=1 Tax=Wolbachia endosymbiont (group E) of Neria commutata TaxID=3066149 RepID=UPI003132B27C